MTASSEDSVPDSWEDFSAKGPDIEGLDKIHPEVSKLFHVLSNDELNTTERNEMMTLITDLRMNDIMSMPPPRMTWLSYTITQM